MTYNPSPMTRYPMFRLIVLLLAATLLAGCSSLSSHQNPTVDFSKFQRYYVERRLTDNHNLDQVIVNDLRRRGLEASCGHLTMMPEKIDIIVGYDDRWTWDFKSYLIELNLTFREARSNKLISTATYRNPGPRTKDPAVMITKILDSFLGKSKAGD